MNPIFLWILNLGIIVLAIVALYFGGYGDAPGGMLGNLGLAYCSQPCWMQGMVVALGIFGVLASLLKGEKSSLVACALLGVFSLPGFLNLVLSSPKIESSKVVSVEHWVKTGRRASRTPMTRVVIEGPTRQRRFDLRGELQFEAGEDIQVTYDSGFVYRRMASVETKDHKSFHP